MDHNFTTVIDINNRQQSQGSVRIKVQDQELAAIHFASSYHRKLVDMSLNIDASHRLESKFPAKNL